MIDPRKTTSIQKFSTHIPQDLTKLIREALEEEYGKRLAHKKVVVEGCIYREEIVVRLGLLEGDSLRQMNFEASIDYTAMKDDSVKLIHVCVDALDSMLAQYLEAQGDIELPRQWFRFELEQREVYLQTSRVNSQLETAADQLLMDNGFEIDGREDAGEDPLVRH